MSRQWHILTLLVNAFCIGSFAYTVTPIYDPVLNRSLGYLIEDDRLIETGNREPSGIYAYATNSNLSHFSLHYQDTSRITYNTTSLDNGDVVTSKVNSAQTPENMRRLFSYLPSLVPYNLRIKPSSATLTTAVKFHSTASHDEVRTCTFITSLLATSPADQANTEGAIGTPHLPHNSRSNVPVDSVDVCISKKQLRTFLVCCPSATAILPHAQRYSSSSETLCFSPLVSSRLTHGCGFARTALLPPPLTSPRTPTDHVSLVNVASLPTDAVTRLRERLISAPLRTVDRVPRFPNHSTDIAADADTTRGDTTADISLLDLILQHRGAAVTAAALSLAGVASTPILTGPHSTLAFAIHTLPLPETRAPFSSLLPTPPLALALTLSRVSATSVRISIRALTLTPPPPSSPPHAPLPALSLPPLPCLCTASATLAPAGFARLFSTTYTCPRACLHDNNKHYVHDTTATTQTHVPAAHTPTGAHRDHDIVPPAPTHLATHSATLQCVARTHILLPEAAFADPYQQLQVDPYRSQVSYIASFADVEAVAGTARGLQVAVDKYFLVHDTSTMPGNISASSQRSSPNSAESAVDTDVGDAASDADARTFSWRVETTVFGRYVMPGYERPVPSSLAALASVPDDYIAGDGGTVPVAQRSSWEVSAGAVQLWCRHIDRHDTADPHTTADAQRLNPHSSASMNTGTGADVDHGTGIAAGMWRTISVHMLDPGVVRGSVPVGSRADQWWVSLLTAIVTAVACATACVAVLRARVQIAYPWGSEDVDETVCTMGDAMSCSAVVPRGVANGANADGVMALSEQDPVANGASEEPLLRRRRGLDSAT